MKKSVLIIEDNEPTREMLASHFRKAGYATMEAIDGEDALKKLKMARPDIIVLDLMMQPMGGFDFVREMLDHRYDFPVVVVTSDESSDVLYNANELGIKTVIRKPVAEDKLLKAVERALR